MATATVEITLPGLTGFTIDLKLYPYQSDTLSYTLSSLTEETNRLGTYTGTQVSPTEGLYHAIALEGSTTRGEGYVYVTDAAVVHTVMGSPADALIGTPAGASIAADIAAIPTAAEIDTELSGTHGATAWTTAASSTLVVSAAAPALTAISAGGTITIHRGDLTTFQLTGLGSLAGRTGELIYFTVKSGEYRDATVTDTVATIQVTENTGAVRLNGATTTASYASITVDDESAGDITIALEHQLTDVLPVASGYYWDVQIINSAGKPVTLTKGLCNINADVTRSNT